MCMGQAVVHITFVFVYVLKNTPESNYAHNLTYTKFFMRTSSIPKY